MILPAKTPNAIYCIHALADIIDYVYVKDRLGQSKPALNHKASVKLKNRRFIVAPIAHLLLH
jgi:hypothetical protein